MVRKVSIIAVMLITLVVAIFPFNALCELVSAKDSTDCFTGVVGLIFLGAVVLLLFRSYIKLFRFIKKPFEGFWI